jgi:hypothetical protein
VQAALQEANMAGAQAIANALTAALQPMVAAINPATAAAVAPAATTPQGPGAAIAFAHTPAQARADLLSSSQGRPAQLQAPRQRQNLC